MLWKNFKSFEEKKILINSYFMANSNAVSLNKIENLQKRALRIVCKIYKTYEDLLLKSVNVKLLTISNTLVWDKRQKQSSGEFTGKFTGKHLRQSLFFNKETVAQVFSYEFAKFLRTPFFIEHLWWLLLKQIDWFEMNEN